MKTKNHTTTFASVDPASGTSSQQTQAYSSARGWEKRGLIDRRFAGAIVCAKDDNVGITTVKLYHTISSTSYLMDSVTLSAGKSAVWTEEDYGIVLGKNDFVKIVVTAGSVGDEANCWVKTYDTYI